jgi:hypothetical protein
MVNFDHMVPHADLASLEEHCQARIGIVALDCMYYYIGITENPCFRFYGRDQYDPSAHVRRGWEGMYVLAWTGAPEVRRLEIAMIARHRGVDPRCTNGGKGGERCTNTCDGCPRFLYVVASYD